LVREIDRVRIVRVNTLLVETRLPIKQIAQQAGFRTAQYSAGPFAA